MYGTLAGVALCAIAAVAYYGRDLPMLSGIARSMHTPSTNETASFVDNHHTPAYGSCRIRGRQERAHRSLQNAQNAFRTATTGLNDGDISIE